MKRIVQLIFPILLLPCISFSQKAYEAIYYSGKTQNVLVKFTLANGYIGACEIKTTDNKTKKTSKFLPTTGFTDADKKMRFDHAAAPGKKFNDYFILEGIQDLYDHLPAKINGNYYFNGTAYHLILTKM